MNLYQLIKSQQPARRFENFSIRSILFQTLKGLDHIHSNGYFHRDIKPENVLVTCCSTRAGLLPGEEATAMDPYSHIVPGYIVKITDFGLARELRAKAPYTSYVSTRWYRAPEILLKTGYYSSPVDMWALGAIAVELALLKPLFPGSEEWDQLFKICEVLGSPEQNANSPGGEWSTAARAALSLGFVMPATRGIEITDILPKPAWEPELAELIRTCLFWDPSLRITAADALRHPFFAEYHQIVEKRQQNMHTQQHLQSQVHSFHDYHQQRDKKEARNLVDNYHYVTSQPLQSAQAQQTVTKGPNMWLSQKIAHLSKNTAPVAGAPAPSSIRSQQPYRMEIPIRPDDKVKQPHSSVVYPIADGGADVARSNIANSFLWPLRKQTKRDRHIPVPPISPISPVAPALQVFPVSSQLEGKFVGRTHPVTGAHNHNVDRRSKTEAQEYGFDPMEYEKFNYNGYPTPPEDTDGFSQVGHRLVPNPLQQHLPSPAYHSGPADGAYQKRSAASQDIHKTSSREFYKLNLSRLGRKMSFRN